MLSLPEVAVLRRDRLGRRDARRVRARPTGTVRAQFTITHTADGIADLLLRLAKLSTDPRICRSRSNARTGGWSTCCSRPGTRWCRSARTRSRAWRDGEVLSGAKSDAGDAAVIAEYLRLRAHRLRPATPFTPRDQGAAHRGPHPRRPGRDARRRDQPARRAAGRALARRQGDLRRHRVADRAGVPDPLPDRRRRRPLGEKRLRRVLHQARLLRPPHRRRAAHPAARRPRRHHRRGPHRGRSATPSWPWSPC